MLVCKRCEGQQFIKKGIVAGKQRYKCKERNLHFREDDRRTNDKTVAKKALCILLYAMANVRHHLGRFTRKTKVVSKCEKMVD